MVPEDHTADGSTEVYLGSSDRAIVDLNQGDYEERDQLATARLMGPAHAAALTSPWRTWWRMAAK